MGVGKTALAKSLLGEEALTTEAKAREDLGKETTTVALDFGTLVVGPYRVHLEARETARRLRDLL
ncbi:hypothetical protein TJA_10550 [Thermus sp. LT1-2-5]